MRASHRARPGRQSILLQMTPLIDVVFLLLSYFLFTFSFRPVEGILPSDLALASKTPRPRVEQPDKHAIIHIIETGSSVRYFLDQWPAASLKELGAMVAELPDSTLFVIDAEPVVTYRYVVDVYNFLLQRRFRKIVFPIDPA